MRVVTLNVWGTRGDWSTRLPLLRDGFAAMAADLVTLQETIRTGRYDQAREILGDGYHLVHQAAREPDGQGVTTASRWPVGTVVEADLHVTDRTKDFACTSLITEILGPDPTGRIWLINNLPDWQLDHENERQLQALVTARLAEKLRLDRPGHVIVAGDFDADPDAASIRFWTGRQALDGFSVCYRDAWESAHPAEPGWTFTADNRYSADWDWPYRRIDYIMVRCGEHGGPTLAVAGCTRTFDRPGATVSDHYGLIADLIPPPAAV